MGVSTPLIQSLAVTNLLQIQSAIDLLKQSGHKRIGFVGLAFKAGTDDLRESPILEVMNDLLLEGYEVKAWDPAIGKDTRIENQFTYVESVCPHLKPTVQALPSLMVEQGRELLENCDAIVVSQNTPDIRELVAGGFGRVEIIDLVRLYKDQPPFQGYQGIGW